MIIFLQSFFDQVAVEFFDRLFVIASAGDETQSDSGFRLSGARVSEVLNSTRVFSISRSFISCETIRSAVNSSVEFFSVWAFDRLPLDNAARHAFSTNERSSRTLPRHSASSSSRKTFSLAATFCIDFRLKSLIKMRARGKISPRRSLKRFEPDRVRGDAVTQIFAQNRQIAVRRANYPHVNGARHAASDAHDALFFDDFEQFGLHFGREFADFVEKNRAAVCRFKFSRFRLEARRWTRLFRSRKVRIRSSAGASSAQLTATNGLSLRGLESWMSCASRVLPVPVSPKRHTSRKSKRARSSRLLRFVKIIEHLTYLYFSDAKLIQVWNWIQFWLFVLSEDFDIKKYLLYIKSLKKRQGYF